MHRELGVVEYWGDCMEVEVEVLLNVPESTGDKNFVCDLGDEFTDAAKNENTSPMAAPRSMSMVEGGRVCHGCDPGDCSRYDVSVQFKNKIKPRWAHWIVHKLANDKECGLCS
jgi:hypothetical protein